MSDETEEESEFQDQTKERKPYKTKPLSPREHHFVKLMADNGMGSIEAARIAFGWRCEPESAESMKARDLARSRRVKAELDRLEGLKIRHEKAKIEIKLEVGEINRENLRSVAFKMLEKMRDGSNKAQTRVNAIKMLKKLHDPAKDINLVWRWIDVAWRYQTAHCPCCHKDFPLSNLENPGLSAWRERNDVVLPSKVLPDRFSRRMELIKKADRRRKPHKSQIQLLAADERHLVGLGAARSGKLTHPDTPILTSKGWKKYKDLDYSDVLFDENGQPTRITGFSQEWTEKDGDWYELEFDSGEKITAHENHEWITHQYNYRAAIQRRKEEYKKNRRKRRGTVRDNWDRSNRRQLASTVVETKEIVRTLFARGGSHVNHAIPVTRPLQMVEQNLPIDPYALGAWLGDGFSLSGEIGIDRDDKEVVDNIPYDIKRQWVVTKNRNKPFLITRFCEFNARLKSCDLIQNKHIPSMYFLGSIEQRLALVQGLMDTDGTIDKKGACNFDNMNKALVDGLAELLIGLSVKVYRRTRRSKYRGKDYGTCYRLNFTTTLPVFRLKRKLDRLPKKVKQTQRYHYIINARKVFSQRGRCIEVDSPSHLYLVGKSLIPTHNSYLLALFAALGIMLPGVECWLLGETFERTSKEVEYLERFLQAILYPHYKKLINKTHDRKTGEAVFRTRWGSEVRVKSAKAKGSITGHALEMALCAEPGWIPPDVYEELRARLSERLGRIIALGTPKGIGGFVGRLTHMTGRDPKTGKVIRWKPEDRLLSKGAPWGVSMLVLNIDPKDNPEYVQSELESARMELSDAEYASEFEGLGIAAEGAKFAGVRSTHCKTVPEEYFRDAYYVLGIDQGAKNFGACLVAYDGKTVVPCWEYMNSDESTSMQSNLYKLRQQTPTWIEYLGGDPENWKLTITDMDPPLIQIFTEMEEANQPWCTDIVMRHKNINRLTDNWRRELQEYVNNLARKDELIFHLFDRDMYSIDPDSTSGAEILHGQVMTCVDVPDNPERESGNLQRHKGWQVSDPFRADHVLDAWYFAMWTIYTNQLVVTFKGTSFENKDKDPWADQKAAFNYALERNEREELRGFRPLAKDEKPGDMWTRYFGGRLGRGGILGSGHYGNES